MCCEDALYGHTSTKHQTYHRHADALSDELKHLRKECRSQARKLEDMHHALAAREEDEDELRSKVGARKCCTSHALRECFTFPRARLQQVFQVKTAAMLVG